MTDMYTVVKAYLGKSRWSQSKEQLHCAFSNLFLKRKLCEAVRFVCARETGGVLQPNDLSLDKTGIITKNVEPVLVGKYMHKKIISCSTLDTYDKILFLFMWK